MDHIDELIIFFGREAGLAPPDPQRALDEFLGFEWTDESTPGRGRALYVVHRILNARRHGQLETDDLQGAFRIALGESSQVQGDLFTNCWRAYCASLLACVRHGSQSWGAAVYAHWGVAE